MPTPHTPRLHQRHQRARPEDGVPRVISHVPDGLDPKDPKEWFRFVGVCPRTASIVVAAQKTHKRCAGKGRFTVAAKGTVTVNCSVDNLREAQFAYGDAFALLYKAEGPDAATGAGTLSSNGATASDVGTIRSCAFGGRLGTTEQRTFVYNKVGIRIGTFISTSSTPSPPRRPKMGTKPAAELTRRRVPLRCPQSRWIGLHRRGTCHRARPFPAPLPLTPAARATAAPRAPPAFSAPFADATSTSAAPQAQIAL